MKPESEQHSLLDDVLTEGAPADFERSLLDGTLRAVRRRRRMQQCGRGLTVVGVFAAIALSVWNALRPTLSVHVVEPALHIVSSQPLPASMVVRTEPGGIVVVTSSSATFGLVEPSSIKDPFQEIDDEQLLALVGASGGIGTARSASGGTALLESGGHERVSRPVSLQRV